MDLKSTFKNTDIEPFYIGGTSATVSESGELLATPINEDVIITNLLTNEIIHRIEGDGELITSLMMTPDGNTLAILSQSQQLRVFDIEQGVVTKNFKMSSPVYISTVDSTSSLFAFGGSDGSITIWDIEGGYVTHSLKGHGTTLCSLAFHGDLGSTEWKLASGDIMGTVKVWDLVKRRCTHTINEHNSAVRGVGFDATGQHLITGGRDNIVIIYKAPTFKPINTFHIKEQIENSGFITLESNQYFFTAGSSNTFRIWDINSGKLLASSPTPYQTSEELMIIDVIRLQSNNVFLVISDQTLVELDLSSFQGLDKGGIEIPVGKRLAGNHGIIADLKYVGPEKNLIGLATNSPSLRIIDPTRPLELRLYEGHKDILNAIDVSSDGNWIVTGSKDNEIRLWKWDEAEGDFKHHTLFQGHAGSVTAVSMSKSKDHPEFIISGSSDLTVKKWKIPSQANTSVKASEYTRRAHDKDINAIDISPNDELFASASYDKLAKVWDVHSGETIGVLKGHKRGLWDVNFYKYDKYIVTGSGDKTIKAWSLNDFTCVKTFEGHTNSIQRVKFFNRSSPQIISTGADGLVKIWDFKSDESLKTFDQHDNRIWAVDVKEDGQLFVTADADGKIIEWEDNTEEEIRLKEQEDKMKVEQEQTLANYIQNNDWSNAFLLALTLNHSMRMYNVIKACIEQNEDEDSPIGSVKLEETIGQLDDEQLVTLFKKIRDWNINFKFFEISQRLLAVVMERNPPAKLMEIKGLVKIIDAIVPYNERHFSRLDDLIEQSYMLDYTVEEMGFTQEA